LGAPLNREKKNGKINHQREERNYVTKKKKKNFGQNKRLLSNFMYFSSLHSFYLLVKANIDDTKKKS
jgi:hypothetical protein